MSKDKIKGSVSQFITDAASHLTDEQVDAAIGFPGRGFFASVKQDRSRIPINMVTKLAALLEVSEPEFLQQVIREYMPELQRMLERNGMWQPVKPLEIRFLNACRPLLAQYELSLDDEFHVECLLTVLAVGLSGN